MPIDFSKTFRPKSGALAFFTSILFWGISVGCFMAALNNYLSEIYHMNSLDRGWLEFFRELPGLALVFILALLHRVSDWKVMRCGTMISMAGAALLLVPADKIFVTGSIMIFSLGEHLVMPVRSAIAMQVAQEGHAGQSLGCLTGMMNFGSVAGSAIVAAVFWTGANLLGCRSAVMFNLVWIFILVLMIVSTLCTFSPNAPNQPSKRPRLYFHRKFSKFYALELFYGARKQIFMTFAPYVLIREYGFSTAAMALMLGICATVNIFAAPAIGKLTDRFGCRNIMIWDTVILSGVCLLYGYAGDLFPPKVALAVVCVNFLLDAIISTTSLATNLYVRDIASDRDELTSTLSTGISINHLIAILSAPLGGWIWQHCGVGVLFTFAAVMAICNSLFAATLPVAKPSSQK
ncbi:MAG: MFS transporter [Lentisphaeria bacterium]|nr:MFS transporter [Lentisphaeria bacterium]